MLRSALPSIITVLSLPVLSMSRMKFCHFHELRAFYDILVNLILTLSFHSDSFLSSFSSLPSLILFWLPRTISVEALALHQPTFFVFSFSIPLSKSIIKFSLSFAYSLASTAWVDDSTFQHQTVENRNKRRKTKTCQNKKMKSYQKVIKSNLQIRP